MYIQSAHLLRTVSEGCFLCPYPHLHVHSALLNTCTSLCSSFSLCYWFDCRITPGSAAGPEPRCLSLIASGLDDAGLGACATKAALCKAHAQGCGCGHTWAAIPGLQVSKDREGCTDLPLQRFPGSPSGAVGGPGHQ